MAAKLLAAAVSLLMTIFIVETGLRLVRDSNRFYPYHKNSERVTFPSEEITPGVSGPNYFRTNHFGCRGPEPNGERIRILTVGGSTTSCTYLDDDETWPALVMKYVNENAGDDKLLWVTNSGIDGLHSQHHLMHAKYLLPNIPDLDYQIVYAGLNDLGMWLYNESFDPRALDDPDHWNSVIGESFRVCNFTAEDKPWYKQFEIWKRASIAKDRFHTRRVSEARAANVIVQDAKAKWLAERQQERQSGGQQFVHRAKMDTLPVALDSYADTLRRIVTAARGNGVKTIFMAQAIQQQFLNESERRRLWMGAMDGGSSFVNETQMVELLAQYNQQMQSVARELDVAFIDLPAQLAGETQLFYDGCHFNERGSRLTGLVVAEFIETHVLRER